MDTSFIHKCNRVIEGGLVFLIVFAPLAFGSVHPWAYCLIQLIVCLLVVAWMFKSFAINRLVFQRNRSHDDSSGFQSVENRRRHDLRLTQRNPAGFVKTPLTLPIILLTAVLLIQLVPLTPASLKLVSPKTKSLYQLTLPGYCRTESQFVGNEKNADRVAGTIARRAIAIDLTAARIVLLKYLSYVLIFYLIINNFTFASDRRNVKNSINSIPGFGDETPSNGEEISKAVAKTYTQFVIPANRLVGALVGTGFIVSMLGILQKLSGTEKIYWLRDTSYSHPFGSFVNENHYVGYINMIVPLVLGLVISRRIQWRSRSTSRNDLFGFLRHSILFIDSFVRKKAIYLLMLIVMISGLILALSRSGILIAMFSVSGYILLYLIGAKPEHRYPVSLMVLIAIVVALSWFELSPVLNELKTLRTNDKENRVSIFLSTWEMSKDFRILGSGAGSFPTLFPMYREKKLKRSVHEAHNDYLQVLVETGIPGLLIVLTFLAIFLGRSLYRLFKTENLYVRAIGTGCLVGICSMLCHSFVDFNLQIPANGMTFFILLGIVHSTL